MSSSRYFAVLAFMAMLIPVVAQAQVLGGLLGGRSGGSGGGLLGGLTGGSNSEESSVLGVVGGSKSGALITIGSNAGSSGTVNLDVGGRDGLVSANVGSGRDPLVNASVLGPRGIADVNVNLGDVRTGVNVGGPGGLVGVDIDLPGGGGVNGTDGANGGAGNGNNGVGNGSGNYGLASGGGGLPACATADPNQLVSLFQQTSPRQWGRATNIQLIPLQVCRDLRNQLAGWLANNPNYHSMVGAVASDGLINAALSRTRYQPGHVLGVQRQGQTLMVYVF